MDRSEIGMKVLMFGWEFPPFNSGGLGTACYGLTKALSSEGAHVTFVLPKVVGKDTQGKTSHVNLVVANNVFIDPQKVKVHFVDSPLMGYLNSSSYQKRVMELQSVGKTADESGAVYGKDLYREVMRYAEKASIIAQHSDADIIHAHDWMTYPAAIRAKEVSGKPLVVHIHATEFDRTADHPDQRIYEIERSGLWAADKVIAVSNLTKNRVVQHYGVDPNKVEVVHNAVEFPQYSFSPKQANTTKQVLFLGRLTIQKGPEYFLYAAKRVLELEDNVKFVVAGNGDMEEFMHWKAKELGIADKFDFLGFVRGKAVDDAYRNADLYVMPSVSEPFGITPLEAMRNSTPVLISKTSGVSEVVSHALKVDFWDIDQMSNKMLSVIRYPALYKALSENGKKEAHTFSWNDPAKKCMDVYNQVVSGSWVVK